MLTAQKWQEENLNAYIKSTVWEYIISKSFQVASKYNSKIK